MPTAQGLPEPGRVLILVATVDASGTSHIEYYGESSWAITTLRKMADNIEEEVNDDSHG